MPTSRWQCRWRSRPLPPGTCRSRRRRLGRARLTLQALHQVGAHLQGVGDREMGEEGVNFYTHLKTVFINYSLSGERSMSR